MQVDGPANRVSNFRMQRPALRAGVLCCLREAGSNRMALRKLPYSRLEPLIRKHLSNKEEESTAELVRRLRAARKRSYLTPYELEAVCYWKSPRAIQYIRSNSPARIRARTRSALATRSERRRLEALRQLKGVSVPMASALLMLLNPKRYGVIDIRVWQLLHKVGTVTKNAEGVGFTFKNWYQFLVLLRYFAKKLGVGARDIERTLFIVHKEYQAGRLYSIPDDAA